MQCHRFSDYSRCHTFSVEPRCPRNTHMIPNKHSLLLQWLVLLHCTTFLCRILGHGRSTITRSDSRSMPVPHTNKRMQESHLLCLVRQIQADCSCGCYICSGLSSTSSMQRARHRSSPLHLSSAVSEERSRSLSVYQAHTICKHFTIDTRISQV